MSGISGAAKVAHQNEAQFLDWLKEQAQRVEDESRIPQDVFNELVGRDYFRMSQPRRHGGLGQEPSVSWARVMDLASGCASCAWVVGLVTANVLMVGKFSEQAQRDVFGCGKPAVVPMLTGGVGFNVTIERRDGGINLSGSWRYASGIDNASWVGLLVDIPNPGGEGAEPYVVLIEAENFRIDHSSWQVLGMRGTGSKNIELDPVFVPEHRFMSWKALQAGEKHPDCESDEAIYDYPLNSIFAMSVAAPTFGVAAAVADEYRAVICKRVNSATRQAQIDDRMAHIQLAMSQANMSIARDTLLRDADLILRKCYSGGPSRELRAEVRSRIAATSAAVLNDAQGIFRSVGGSLLPSNTRMQRLFRDLHAMSSHFLLQKEPIGELYGRLLLDLDLPAGARL
ncbi:acyl-CoA dehydrogenase family protein [Epibacterium sp. Ofav1-8]|uniref:acyl-CoA dehydrogenase family protein n=1 Tax=Epibacterium sp. Ofav1-8 TaxID=2917735 RepID=UPI001EF517D2|nr:acyl-CoA dehydrogenase family protein [Epibacterium sp. Ofav1-8]MCG7625153.1 hypothetical protein [Epibacterium sp. Ofav1-8]